MTPSSARLSALLLSLALLPACGSISLTGIDGFTPQSQVWLSKAESTGRSHELVLTSIGDYCRQRRTAEQGRQEALELHHQRLDEGTPACESQDLFWDDMADAYRAIEKDGAMLLTITLDRSGVGDNVESRTAPGPGTFDQISGGDGGFAAQVVEWTGDYFSEYAEAYTCVSPEELDETNFFEWQATFEPGIKVGYNVAGGTVEVAEGGDDAWDVDLSGDLQRGTDTIGQINAQFTAAKCELDVSDEALRND